jgi:hypothetical protein
MEELYISKVFLFIQPEKKIMQAKQQTQANAVVNNLTSSKQGTNSHDNRIEHLHCSEQSNKMRENRINIQQRIQKTLTVLEQLLSNIGYKR